MTIEDPFRVQETFAEAGYRRLKPTAIHGQTLRVFWFTAKAFTEGIETHIGDEVSVRVYSPKKTPADCFNHQNKIGIDTVIEALKRCQQSKPVRVDDLLRFAFVCRVMKP